MSVRGTRLPSLQKLAGILAMLFFLVAGVCLIDALLGGMKGRQSTVDLLPDSLFAISGPMPPKTDIVQGFVIEGEPEDGGVRLLPKEIFSGYWLGGSMWRGNIAVGAHAQPGIYTISVKDQFGEKQNPALVFSVQIWANENELNAHSPSRLTRMTGLNPFVFVVGFALCGMVMAAANFYCGRSWRRYLASKHCGEVHMLKRKEQSVELQCEIIGMIAKPVLPGTKATLYRPLGEAVGTAAVLSVKKNDVTLLVDAPADKVRLGDVACLHVDELGADQAKLDDQQGHKLGAAPPLLGKSD